MIGGLGNQMFIYAFALHLSKIHPNTRIDLSDMVHYHVHNGYELPRVFGLADRTVRMPQWVKKTLEFLFFNTILERKQRHDTLRPFERHRLWPFIYYKGFYQSERYFKDVEEEVRKAFAFRPSQASERTRGMLAQIEADRRAVSLHVRRGDYLKPRHWEDLGSVCQRPYYENALREMNRLRSDARFYVFSDDPKWVQENLQLPADTVFVDWNHGLDSWQDMMLMSRCRAHIICNSTFSWWGAWLNPRADKTVIAPARWFRHSKAPGILPESWVKVPID